MTRNLGSSERLLRALVVAPVAILLALFVFGADSVLGVIALVVAFAMLATALISWCPIWRALGLNTCRPEGGSAGGGRDMRQAANVSAS
jgi:hypothetical protein